MEFLLALFFMLIVCAVMAIGAIFANKPIKGSCGGIQALGLGGECDICGGDTQKCEEENKFNNKSKALSSTDFYDASNHSS